MQVGGWLMQAEKRRNGGMMERRRAVRYVKSDWWQGGQMSDLVLEGKRVSRDIIEKGEGRGPGVLEPEPDDRGWILALRWSVSGACVDDTLTGASKKREVCSLSPQWRVRWAVDGCLYLSDGGWRSYEAELSDGDEAGFWKTGGEPNSRRRREERGGRVSRRWAGWSFNTRASGWAGLG
jgi:hypothetical protein